MKSNLTLTLLAGAVALAAPRAAKAQANVALDRYQPSPAGDALFAIPDAGTASKGLSAKVDFSYARAPLVLTRVTGSVSDATKIVTHQAISHQLLSLRLLSRLTLDLDLPVTWSQAGNASPSSDFASPQKATLNDLRVGARLGLLQQAGSWPGAALTGSLFLPTGDRAQFSGSGHARYAIGVTTGTDYEHGLWRAFVERRWDEDNASTLHALLGSSVAYGVGLAWKWRGLQLGPELYGVTRANGLTDRSTATNLEALLGARYRVAFLVFGAAGGPGLTRAPGTPSYRLLASIAFCPRGEAQGLAPREAFDASSASTEQLESGSPSKAGANGALTPDARARDADGDGVPDAADQCPNIPGEAKQGAQRLGCPPDADGDGIADQDDQCPQVPGPASADPIHHGCPLDTDGDGVLDPVDACVNEKGPLTSEPSTSGCPKALRVEGSQIVILQQVTFKTGSDVIEEVSFDLLGQLAHALAEHPEIARLGVDGHTDDVGLTASNLSLSRRRAIAVVRWLVLHGVDERRLEARGFGPRRPLVPNTSDEARTKNRRVEFTIVKRTTRGSEGWADGDANHND